MKSLTDIAAARPKMFMWLAAAFSLIMIGLVALPTLLPETFPYLRPLKIDTDPENMLAEDEPVRVFHNAMKRKFGVQDMIVVGVINEGDPNGVFTPATLANVYDLGKFAETIIWDANGGQAGVVALDVISPTSLDSIEQAGLGTVKFDWLMPKPPETAEQALTLRDRMARLPILDGTIVSGDGLALALYVPITAKDVSYKVATALRERISTYEDGATWHITGLTIAQDQFGVEMFVQMAISAPAAMALIFLLMWLFFRRVNLITSPMLVAMVAVIGTMGTLVAMGNTVHIMSSMIPIFVMPIAVLDAVHILSDFYDRYPSIGDRRKTLTRVMDELWKPMLFTTLTTCAGFGSLALTPIPPVQTFGIYVALGVFLAWFLTITLVPAYIMLIPERAFEGFGIKATATGRPSSKNPFALTRFLFAVGRFAQTRARLVMMIFLATLGVAGYGIAQIVINDNPVKWFNEDHDIRVADRALNARFAGTYMAYLTLSPADQDDTVERYAGGLAERMGELGGAPGAELAPLVGTLTPKSADKTDLLDRLLAFATERQDAAPTDRDWEVWDDAIQALGQEKLKDQIFKRPDVLKFVEDLQRFLQTIGLVGKSNGLPDVIKTVHRDLFLGDEEAFRIPDTPAAVAQTLITFQNSHRPHHLWKMVTPDYRTANLWLQLKSGDNMDMTSVVAEVDRYMADHPAPVALSHNWYGLTYINVVWQEKMVNGMITAFLGSFVMVLILMVVLFRSLAWGLLCMVPLSVTIATIYGVIGLIGKDYDMPVAILSSLSLGLAVDYAIHFCVRTRAIHERIKSWKEMAGEVFGEPARAIFRNVIIIGCGFFPLLAAPLVPYQTVGVFISAILLLAGLATLLVLPALITIFQGLLLKEGKAS
jgi:hypothetical protein